MTEQLTQREAREKHLVVGCMTLFVAIMVGMLLWAWFFEEMPTFSSKKQQRKDDELAIERVFQKFETAILAGDFLTAYTCMTPAYRERTSLEFFTRRFEGLQTGRERMEPQRFIYVRENVATLLPKGSGQDHGLEFEFERIEETWFLTGKTILIQK